jgi:hypothetical protein
LRRIGVAQRPRRGLALSFRQGVVCFTGAYLNTTTVALRPVDEQKRVLDRSVALRLLSGRRHIGRRTCGSRSLCHA